VPDTGCTPLTVNYTNTSNARNGENINTMTFDWRLNGNTFATTQNIIPQTYTNPLQRDSVLAVRLIGTTQHGCKDTANRNILVQPDAKAQFNFNSDLECAPFTITAANIQATSYPLANSAYEWYANDSIIGTGLSFPGYTIIRANDSVRIKLKAISISGCKNDSFTHVFKTIPNPKPLFTFNDSVGCTPFTYNIINQSTPSTGVSYQWSAGNLSSNFTAPTFTHLNSGVTDTTVRIRLVITVGNTGCKDSLDKFIVVKPLPRPNFIFSSSNYCFPRNILVSNTTTPPPPVDIRGYKWKVSGSTPATVANDTASAATAIIIPDNQTGNNRTYAIQLIATSDFGCTDSISKNISTPSRPIAQFDFATDSLCSYEQTSTVNSSGFGTNFTWRSLSNNLSISTTNSTTTNLSYPMHRGQTDSVYRLRLVVENSDGCQDSIEKNIVVHPKPVAAFAPNTNVGCTPLTVNFANTTIVTQPATYNWRLEAGIFSTQTNPVHTFNGSPLYDTTYTVRLIANSKFGCLDTTTRQIVAKSSAVAVIRSPDSVYCMNSALRALVQFNNLSFGDADTFIYQFGDGTTFITTSDTSVSHTYISEGIYKVILTAKNACRTSKDSILIKILKSPDPEFSISDTLGCGPLTVSFNNTTTNFEANYLWDFGNGQTSGFRAPSPVTFIQSKLTDTTYIVKLTVSNRCGLKAVQDTVRVLPLPVANFLLSVDSGCSPLPVAFINTSTGLPASVKWYFGNGDSSIRYNPTQVVYRTEDTNTVYTITLIAQNICGIDTARRQLLVKPNTVRAFFRSSGNFGCAPYTVSFTDNSTGGTSTSWNFGNGQSSGAQNPTVTFLNAGTYTVSQFVNNGCSFDTAIMIITVLPTPRFTVGKDKNTACVKEPVRFTANLTDSGSITWYFSPTDSSNQFNPIYRYTTPGKKIIRVVLRSLVGPCTTTIFDSVFINPLPTIPLTVDTNQGCVYKNFSLGAGASTGQFFFWEMGDGTTKSGRFINHTYASDGVYAVRLIAETGLGCKDTVNTTVRVYPKPAAAFDYSPKDTCQGPVTVSFINQTTGGTDYVWSFGNGSVSTDQNPKTVYNSPGAYAVELIANNEYGCKDTANRIYNVYNIPEVSFNFTPNQGCQPLEVSFTNTSLYGTDFQWLFGDGNTSTTENPKHTYANPGSYDVKLIVTNGGICTDSFLISKAITVHPKPTSLFDTALNLLERPYRFMQFNNLSSGAVRYVWQFGDGRTSAAVNPYHEYRGAGNYTVALIAISDKGCADTLYLTAVIPEYIKGLYVPNAFTPDYGQPEVRVFKPAGIELETYHIQVYNKFGVLVWESESLIDGKPAEVWDGTDKYGKPCPQGSYVWFIKAQFTDGTTWSGQPDENGKLYGTSQRPGNVTIIR
jgi:PKD repeat protein